MYSVAREKKLDIIEIAQQESENGQAENSGSGEHDRNEEAEESEEGGEDEYPEDD